LDDIIENGKLTNQTFELKNIQAYDFKVFVWDSLEFIKPLCTAYSYR